MKVVERSRLPPSPERQTDSSSSFHYETGCPLPRPGLTADCQARAQNRTVKAMECDRGCFVDNSVARECAVVVGCLTANVHWVALRSSPTSAY
jgi:hypothetical protein